MVASEGSGYGSKYVPVLTSNDYSLEEGHPVKSASLAAPYHNHLTLFLRVVPRQSQRSHSHYRWPGLLGPFLSRHPAALRIRNEQLSRSGLTRDPV